MRQYFVTYDVVANDLDEKPPRERQDRIESLLRTKYGARQTLSNQWCLGLTRGGSRDLLEDLKTEFGLSDRSVVVEWLGQVSHYWTIESISEWRDRPDDAS